MRLRIGFLLAALFVTAPAARAASFTIDFESFSEFDEPGTLSTPLGDIVFGGATVLRAASAGGTSLFEEDFPPYAGSAQVLGNVIVDPQTGAGTFGPMSIGFGASIYSFGGYFTYSSPLTLLFTLGDGSTATVNSLHDSNLGLDSPPGPSPNELIQFSSEFGITNLLISLGAPLHPFYSEATFALDNLTVSNDLPVPEPGTLLLLGTGAATAYVRRRRQNQAR